MMEHWILSTLFPWLGELNENFGVEIGVEDLQPENFNSADAMLALITRLED